MQCNMIWLTYLLHSVIDKGLFGALGLLKNMAKWFFSDWHYEVGYFLVPVLSNEPEFKIDMKWIYIFKFEDFFLDIKEQILSLLILLKIRDLYSHDFF